MNRWTDSLFILVVIIDFFLLAASRLRAMIRAAAAQGALLSLLALVLAWGEAQVGHTIALAAGALVVKGALIPWLLYWAIHEASIRREVEPIVGFVPSLVGGSDVSAGRPKGTRRVFSACRLSPYFSNRRKSTR